MLCTCNFSRDERNISVKEIFAGKDKIMWAMTKKYSYIFINWEIRSLVLIKQTLLHRLTQDFKSFDAGYGEHACGNNLEKIILTNCIDFFGTFCGALGHKSVCDFS